MADLAVVDASVVPAAGAVYRAGAPPLIAGEAITAGQSVYIKASDGKVYKAKANTATAPIAPATWPPEVVAVGIAMTHAAAGQGVLIVTSGGILLGVAVVPGMLYTVSPNNAGGISPFADLLAGQTPAHWVHILGWGAADALTLVVNPLFLQVAR